MCFGGGKGRRTGGEHPRLKGNKPARREEGRLAVKNEFVGGKPSPAQEGILQVLN